MTDFSNLASWHKEKGINDEKSPVLFVHQDIVTITIPNIEIYDELNGFIHQYMPIEDESNLIISYKRDKTGEIYQIAEGAGWDRHVKLHMENLKLTLKNTGKTHYLEDEHETTIFESEDDGSYLKIINWRVDHQDIVLEDEIEDTFLDTITWEYCNGPSSMTFNTLYSWRGYRN